MLTFRPFLFCTSIFAASLAMPAPVDEASSVEGWISKTEAINSTAARKAVGDFRRDVSDLDAVYAKGFDKARSTLNTKLEKAHVAESPHGPA